MSYIPSDGEADGVARLAQIAALQAEMARLQYLVASAGGDPPRLAVINNEVEAVGEELSRLMNLVSPDVAPIEVPNPPRPYKIRMRLGLDQDWVYGEGSDFEHAVLAAKAKIHHRGLIRYQRIGSYKRVENTTTALVTFKDPKPRRKNDDYYSPTYEVEIMQEARHG